ncbi:c-type cytochrome [Afipia sp. Root123D2]|uniref:c-type cytochrome n=1 Tax=Afipia sp. Root123D2 TaxID=1736436 RepID=UPI001FCCE74A|nr:c-type cytochrome [Afipia sp. Root123D2]
MTRAAPTTVIAVILILLSGAAMAQMRGHGGPVRAVAISPDGRSVLSGSFDTSVIRWSVATGFAEQVLRFHSSAVNAVVFLSDTRMATAGADARIAIWSAGRPQPDTILSGHNAPIAALAISPDRTRLASASWDSSVRLWPLDGSGKSRVLEGHSQNVNGVAFTPDGRSLVSVGYDLTVRIWPLAGGAPDVVTLPSPLNAVAIASDGGIAAGAADGKVYFLTRDGKIAGESKAGRTPVISLAVSPDGALLAAASIGGSVTIIDRNTQTIARTLVGPGLPVWSVAFFADDRTLLTGGADHTIRRWNALTGELMGSPVMGAPGDPLAAFAGDHGAEMFRSCIACHTLSKDDGARAGPTLAGIFGRRIASLPGYNFSEALKKMDIIWTPESVAKLFEIGPAAYTPGTKMPEQRIASPEDRRALIDFLARVTAK